MHLILHDVLGQQPVSGLNAADKASIFMKCMPLTFAFGGFGAWVLKYLHLLIVVSIKTVTGLYESWYIDIIFYIQNRTQGYCLKF